MERIKCLSTYDNLVKYFAIYIATFIVRIINAVWHGGEAKYFFNGFYNGLLIILGLQCQPLFAKWLQRLHIRVDGIAWKIFGIIRTFCLVSVGRVLVKADNLAIGFGMWKSVFTTFNPWVLFDESLYNLGIGRKEFQCLLIALCLLSGVSYLQEKGFHIRESIAKQNIVVRWGIYYAAVFAVLIFGVYGIGYDAGSFIYMQF